MPQSPDSEEIFDLPPRLEAKAADALIGDDRRHLARVAAALRRARDDVAQRLAAARRAPAGSGQRALERDLEIRRLSAHARVLGRFGVDLCIGKMVDVEGRASYIGRFGLADGDENRLVTDWRAPASEPFFAASVLHPMGMALRRRYRWSRGRIVDYWDEVFSPDGVDHSAALDDESAFLASLGASRSAKMRDVLATIQSDQDAIIRAGARGARVVDGGPGTGKTVVALHRAAYLLYSDHSLAEAGGLLFVGPHRPYVEYVDDVLPSLGEEGALVCAIGDLSPGADPVARERDPAVRQAKGSSALVDGIEAAVRIWQRPPQRATSIDTAWGDVVVSAAEWAEIFEADDGASHNAVRTQAWQRLIELLAERIDELGAPTDDRWSDGWGDASRPAERGFDAYGTQGAPDDSVREALENDEALRAAFDRLWPLLDPDALLRGLLSSPQMLRRCAPALGEAGIRSIVESSSEWSDVDGPLRDAARFAVGDPRVQVRADRARRDAAAEARVRADVVRDLIAADDGDLKIMSMLRGQDLRRTLARTEAVAEDPLAGPFGHIVVDEAQELTEAQWRMVLRRCPSRSLTIVGDRAQARAGFAESWTERLTRVGVDRVTVSTLGVNYRTPEEVMEIAGPVIRAALPDANVPISIRRSGVPVRRARRDDLGTILDAWEAQSADGTAVVIGEPTAVGRERVRVLTPELVKGLEFDLVVLVEPRAPEESVTGAVDRYVAMTRATQELVLLW
jgi:DNA helicase IV